MYESPPPADPPTSHVPITTPDVPQADRAVQGPFQPNTGLALCRPQITNPPPTDAFGRLVAFNPLILVNGETILATAPVNDVCLSSGFGPRYGRPHKGLDLVADRGSVIYSAGPGRVVEARHGRGFGLFVTLDHGGGVYTRYAHLDSIDPDITRGVVLGFGQPIGRMGKTGNATATHLHYEILTGRWGPKGSFGLAANDPLTFPGYSPNAVADLGQTSQKSH